MSESKLDRNSRVELNDATEGERIGTEDLFFHKIGESVPIKPSHHIYELDTIPSQPLSVSEHLGLVFVAHSNGFFVARIKDVIESAKEIKVKGSGSSIQELSILDVMVGRVHVVALSAGSSTLAACVGASIHLYSVKSLINKDKKPSFSCSVSDLSSVKSLHWNNNVENSYIVLSNNGKLYHGSPNQSLQNVMDDVDAAEWSVTGKFVAVARKNVLSILSSKFKERSSMLLPFDSCIEVDTLRWVRRDCIILGCIQLSEDGEEDYLVQVITSKNSKITDVSSKPTILYFREVFEGLTQDMVASRSGPNLLLTYLKECELAITANRKNMDQHIVLIGWSVCDDSSEAAVIDIGREKLLPRIELQGVKN